MLTDGLQPLHSLHHTLLGLAAEFRLSSLFAAARQRTCAVFRRGCSAGNSSSSSVRY
jgi:hypothetical protein